jgi:hypothetical protein
MSDRDYLGEMRQLIDAETGGGEYYVGTAAESIVAKLQITDPELLQGWLDRQAVAFVRAAITARDRSVRTYARIHASRSVFRDAVQRHEGGDQQAMRGWLDTAYTVENGARKRLGQMTRADVLYIAESFERRMAHNGLRAALMRAIATKVRKTGIVSDYLTNEQIDRLWNQV